MRYYCGMIGAERVLAERTLAILTELRSEEPPKIDYLEAVARAIALQPGIRFPNEVAADKRASASVFCAQALTQRGLTSSSTRSRSSSLVS